MVTSAGKKVVDRLAERREQALADLTADIPRGDLEHRTTLRRILEATELQEELPSARDV